MKPIVHTRDCAHCGQPFPINPRLGRRHRFCSKPECAAASRRAAQRKWLRRNGGKHYYHGDHNTDRVRAWRRCNPRYWAKKIPEEPNQPKIRLTSELAEVARLVALQDTIDSRFALEIGIISALTGAALQDTIARKIRKLMLRGYAILRNKGRRARR